MKNITDKFIWYRQPGQRFMEGLPVGNGRLGGLLYGGSVEETIQLDESTCLSGEASLENVRPDTVPLIPQIREALFRHDHTQATQLAEGIKGLKANYGTNLPFGKLHLSFDHGESEPGSYRRELCLNNGVARVEYAAGGVKYERELFASNPAQVIVLRLSASEPHRLGFKLALDSGDLPSQIQTDAAHDLVLAGHAYENIHSDGQTGVATHARLRVVQDGGELVAGESGLEVKGANSAVVYVALGTTFGGKQPEAICRDQIEAAAAKGFEAIRREHEADFRRFFDRVAFELGRADDEDLPTDERLKRVQAGQYDPALTTLLFHYGRYLLLSCSREDSPLPAHLQGGWNDNEACRMGWTCDLHLDINTEMNYWPADVTNLAESNWPLVNWIQNTLVPSGRNTARKLYGTPGWVAHTVSNAWGYSAPGWDVSWGMEPFCGVWIASHLWETYRFTQDQAFLAEHVYPVIKEAAEFAVSYLVPAGGYLMPGPSISPENTFAYDGKNYQLDMGATYAVVETRNLLQTCLEAAAILGVDEELQAAWRETLAKLPPFQIGKQGQLQEWREDYEEPDPTHRHISHLLSVYPYGQIDPETTPELAEAAHVTLMRRLYAPKGYEEMGWARCMVLTSSARLFEAEDALRQVQAIEQRLTETNLFTFDPPGAGALVNILELDGNTGLTAGIAEMLVQSHRANQIDLLPALPRAWKEGKAKGLCGRGGFEVELAWQNGELTMARLTSKLGRSCQVRYRNRVIALDTVAGETYSLDFGPAGKL